MQQTISNGRIAIQSLPNLNYWADLVLNITASFFLDENQVNFLKAMLTMFVPIAIVYTKARVSDVAGLAQAATNGSTGNSLCHLGCSY